MPDLFSIIHLGCYVLALIPSAILTMSIDYPKFIKARSNMNYYIAAICIAACSTFIMGEFIYNLITLFIK